MPPPFFSVISLAWLITARITSIGLFVQHFISEVMKVVGGNSTLSDFVNLDQYIVLGDNAFMQVLMNQAFVFAYHVSKCLVVHPVKD